MTTNLQQLIPVLNKVVFNNLNSITQSELDLVNTLANACPFTDGVAVNYAQGILKSIDHTYVANNKYNCSLNGIEYKKPNNINLYPGQPPFSIVDGIISFPVEVMQDCMELNIYNIYGQLIKKTTLSESVITTALWPNGIYVLQVIRKNKTVRNYKFNISK